MKFHHCWPLPLEKSAISPGPLGKILLTPMFAEYMWLSLKNTTFNNLIIVASDIQFSVAQAKHAQDCSCVNVACKCQTLLTLLQRRAEVWRCPGWLIV